MRKFLGYTNLWKGLSQGQGMVYYMKTIILLRLHRYNNFI